VTPQQWREVDAVLSAALDLPESEQDAFVARECAGRAELRVEVESLLRAHRAAGSFIEPLTRLTVEGQRIGPYRLAEQIGVGGMGTVYRAEREDEQFRQEVAIKLMGPGLEIRPEAVRRFLEERQILAGLAHPNIARLLDGGYTAQGTPYIVMEHVAGTPITAFCEQHGLDLRTRLQLFLDLAEGVQFAHQHLVIHRDIKPANVLVTDEGVPKLLDFGIAKLLDARADGTLTIARALTPDYASPEQIRGTVMTTASDVYSLGVLLYELVARQRPYRLGGQSLEKAIECVCTCDPPPPGTVCVGLPDDVDAIVLKAMRKEPARRYGSVRELADDIGRFLALRPVLARHGTLRYVGLKFVRRHRTALGVAATVAVLLGGSAAVVIRESHVVRQERNRAQRRFNEVRQLAHTVIFDLEDKIASLPGSTPVRKELIATAIGYVDRLANEAAGDPSLQIELARAYIHIGNVQGDPNEQNLGDTRGAMESYEKAERIARALVAATASFESRMLLIETIRATGAIYFAGDPAKAKRSKDEALAIARDLERHYPNNEDAKRLLAFSLFDIALFEEASQSQAYRLEALPLFEALLKAKPADPSRQRNVALINKYIGGPLVGSEPDRAFPYFQRATELDEARLASKAGAADVKLDLSFDYSQIGTYYWNKEDLPKALEYFRKTVSMRRELAASDPQDVWKQDRLAWALTSTAEVQLASGESRDALANLDEAKRIGERLAFSDIRMETLAYTFVEIGAARRKRGQREAACSAYARAHELYRRLSSIGRSDPRNSEVEKSLEWCGSR
jgi:tetratricopeptide (TPR) repeat protein